MNIKPFKFMRNGAEYSFAPLPDMSEKDIEKYVKASERVVDKPKKPSKSKKEGK